VTHHVSAPQEAALARSERCERGAKGGAVQMMYTHMDS
jgi:hypothetical protein